MPNLNAIGLPRAIRDSIERERARNNWNRSVAGKVLVLCRAHGVEPVIRVSRLKSLRLACGCRREAKIA